MTIACVLPCLSLKMAAHLKPTLGSSVMISSVRYVDNYLSCAKLSGDLTPTAMILSDRDTGEFSVPSRPPRFKLYVLKCIAAGIGAAMTTLMVYHYCRTHMAGSKTADQEALQNDGGVHSGYCDILAFYGPSWRCLSQPERTLYLPLDPQKSDTTMPTCPFRCLWLCVIVEVCETVIVFLLQGMIALRVHLLLLGVLSKGTFPLVLFATGFTISQFFNIIGTMLYIASSVGHTADNDILGIEYCGDAFNADGLGELTGTIFFPLANYSMIAFEVILGLSAMYYVASQIREGNWRDRKNLQGTVVSVLVRDNLFYFLA
ncbi:hypothetical protein CONPUDRAFT_76742 [Coniophora puteana RWD-64-598 SS2]|uniref:Uncharacterized protein n=1 Tax=Coniophora puteana (strain RWD-64-598) TaxID=741705 RepID=A0A5M3MAY5_CONPW|nr:uncharacterized protein CONPUDRAFT_76742 [Coniophora puteana RWD-64-598 SS2]EIW76389.1 hypothetical protein CONPUDRAFT_76742 [Coniophora puteana RWD-64-598 SS2]